MKPKPLSDRHKQVLQMLSEGHQEKVIAQKMGVPISTVNSLTRYVRVREAAPNNTALVAKAIRNNWIP